MILVKLFFTQHLSKHIDPFFKTFDGIWILAQIKIGKTHSVKSFSDNGMFGFISKGDYFDFFLQNAQGFLWIFDLPVSLGNINNSFHWSRIMLAIILSIDGVLFFKEINCRFHWRKRILWFSHIRKQMVCFRDLFIINWRLSDWKEWIHNYLYHIFFVTIEILTVSFDLRFSYLYQRSVIAFLFHQVY